MINKKLIGLSPDSMQYIIRNLMSMWIGLIANIVGIFEIVSFIVKLYNKELILNDILLLVTILCAVIIVRYISSSYSSKMSHMSSKTIKLTLRTKIYKKLLELGSDYRNYIKTSEIVQLSVEGVDQIEIYFGNYLPQFFYSLLAPTTLLVVFCFINIPSALALFLCVPLIPITLALVQTFARKLLDKYWGEYMGLGSSFLENLQGLTTLKVYGSDEVYHKKMNKESERFRLITMKVLSMQLNSIIIMDVIAYGGAALGMVIALIQYNSGKIDMFGALFIILLAADFFIPMRRLGSYFHIAMNGMAASKKIFQLLECSSEADGELVFPKDKQITINNLNFCYEKDRKILNHISIEIPINKMTAIVGESGSGKSTIARILCLKHPKYEGEIKIGEINLLDIKESSLLDNITYVGHNNYVFKGTIRDNLLMANTDATDSMMIEVLKEVNLFDYINSQDGLDTLLLDNASNISGGQKQRLVFARALLANTPIYIFDEATSNIDVESEAIINKKILELTTNKSVVMISHRLANVVNSDNIYVLKQGTIVEKGSHSALLYNNGEYAKLWNKQKELEQYRMGGRNE